MSTCGFPMNKVEALTMLYLQNQDLKNTTPEQLATMYKETEAIIRSQFGGSFKSIEKSNFGL